MAGFRRPRLSGISGAASAIVVGADPHTMGLIRETLGTEAALPEGVVAYGEALTMVQRSRPDVVIMSFLDFDQAIRLGTTIQQEVPGCHLVAVAARPDPEHIRADMRAGFREFAVLPEDADLLRKAVHEAAYAGPADEDRGKLAVLCGAKGGSGVTLLAVNLAAELAPVHRVLLVDMDFSMGDVAAFLDLTPSTSIVNVIKNIQRLDERLLGGSVTVHQSRVHVLAQPHEPQEQEFEISGDIILRLLHATALSYEHVLVDVGGRTDEAALTAMTVADLVLLVCTPDVPSIRNAWRRLKLLDHIGIERDRIRLVVNRMDRTLSISKKDIEANLGIDIAATVTNDSKTAITAVNEGRLLREVNRRSPAARDLAHMVALIAEGVQKVAPASTGLFGRML